MINRKYCTDFYGEKLKIGDEVIPVFEQALMIGISGIVSQITYSEKYYNYYITITDKNGNVLIDGIDARYYTTQARYDERENQKYVYSLTFFDQNLFPITSIPLTNRTDPHYEIPDETCFVALKAEHLSEKRKQLTENSWTCNSYTLSDIYSFFVDGKFKLCHEDEDDIYYLRSFENHSWCIISNNYKMFQNEQELKDYIKSIIEYFNSADLTHVNNDEEFGKNENGQNFEKKLIYYLKH